MKRLNPETGLIFKKGDVRTDGFVFKHYKTSKINAAGFFYEEWASPDAFVNHTNGRRSYYTNPKGRARLLLSGAKTRKKDAVSITIAWIEEKLIQGACELTGLPFDFNSTTKTQYNPYAPSLDRIDSSIDEYSPDNTRVVLVAVNSALNQYGEQTMLPILKAMVSAIEKKHG